LVTNILLQSFPQLHIPRGNLVKAKSSLFQD